VRKSFPCLMVINNSRQGLNFNDGSYQHPLSSIFKLYVYMSHQDVCAH